MQHTTAQSNHRPLADAADQLAPLLAWLHRLLDWQVRVTRQLYGALADDTYRGLYIPDAEADLLRNPWPHLDPELAAERQQLAAERQRLEHEDGSALQLLGQRFGLSSFERDVLLLALAPEIDLRYERLYAYIQDDVTKKRPTVDLALRLLCLDGAAMREARTSFTPQAPLLQQRLIQLFDDGQRQPALLARFLKLDDRIAAELLFQPSLDPQLATCCTLRRPTRSFDTLVFDEPFIHQLRQIIDSHSDGLVLALQGLPGSGRRALTEALCAERSIPLLEVALDRLLDLPFGPDEAAARITREATLTGAALLIVGAETLLHSDELRPWRSAILDALGHQGGLTILPIEQPWEARGQLRAPYLRMELPDLSYTQREQIWALQFHEQERPADELLQQIASTFRLTGGQIRNAVAMARSLARWHGGPIAKADLFAACRAQSSGKLRDLAHKIRTTYTWKDIVLPREQLTQLQEISVQVRHRRVVLESWGFDRHLAMGKGVNVLFAGPSGTGKTMAAEIIASDLGLELFKVDLATMVSKYIGETEKNLDRIFRAAREANAILFFDEADAIFGKRSEVKDAQDRYANIEVGYLLQKMEEYDGVVILSTNLRKNMDDAFVRRLHVTIDFPFPEEEDRLTIWKQVFPPEAPLSDDVDLTFAAKQFKLAGGNIRNIALLSAFLAAEEGQSIAMQHVIRATKREYQKLGKLITQAEFGVYLPLARG